MKLPTTRDGKPVLDEATFQKLLAAAYVLQEHRERAKAAEESTRSGQAADPEYAHTLAEIVETQQQILMRRMGLDDAAGYVAEQLRRITSAAGAAIGLLDQDRVIYRAASGLSASRIGTVVAKDRVLSATVLARAMVLRCPNIRLDSQVNPEIVNGSGIASFVAVPIFHDDQIAGAIELAFAKVNGFTEYDVHTCQMMAGLVTEALARADDEKWKRSLAAERDSMLQALEKLKPQLDQLAKDAGLLSSGAVSDLIRNGDVPAPRTPISPKPTAAVRNSLPAQTQRKAVAEDECHNCGNHLGEQEVYCGSCGTLRSERPVNGHPRAESDPEGFEDALPDSKVSVPPGPAPAFSAGIAKQRIELPPEVLALVENEPESEPNPDVSEELLKLLPPEDWEGQHPSKPEPATTGYPWTSAAHARDWLNSVSDPKVGVGFLDFLRIHRGDVSLAAAILLVLVAIFWSRTDHVQSPAVPSVTSKVNSSASEGSSGNVETEASPQQELSVWDRTLVALGLAEAPITQPRPTPMGNPEVSVWVDLHTALYYCPGAELYGKTQKGRFAKQSEAQSDRFEPASGRVCE